MLSSNSNSSSNGDHGDSLGNRAVASAVFADQLSTEQKMNGRPSDSEDGQEPSSSHLYGQEQDGAPDLLSDEDRVDGASAVSALSSAVSSSAGPAEEDSGKPSPSPSSPVEQDTAEQDEMMRKMFSSRPLFDDVGEDEAFAKTWEHGDGEIKAISYHEGEDPWTHLPPLPEEWTDIKKSRLAPDHYSFAIKKRVSKPSEETGHRHLQVTCATTLQSDLFSTLVTVYNNELVTNWVPTLFGMG